MFLRGLKVSQKILPYKIPKMMLTYPYNAFYFGILEANNINCDDIILNDFLLQSNRT